MELGLGPLFLPLQVIITISGEGTVILTSSLCFIVPPPLGEALLLSFPAPPPPHHHRQTITTHCPNKPLLRHWHLSLPFSYTSLCVFLLM
jgi:hypothetical protein